MDRLLDRVFPCLVRDPADEVVAGWARVDPRPWAWLDDLDARIRSVVAPGVRVDTTNELVQVSIEAEAVYLAPGARVEPGVVMVQGPIYVGPDAVLRAHAYIRGPAWIGEGAVVGHASEIKSSVLLKGAHAPHFAFVGDSVVGAGANLGAGVRLANFRIDGRAVRVAWGETRLETGRRKLGALVGDGASLGCNSVTNPGTVLAAGVRAPALSNLRGFVSAP